MTSLKWALANYYDSPFCTSKLSWCIFHNLLNLIMKVVLFTFPWSVILNTNQCDDYKKHSLMPISWRQIERLWSLSLIWSCRLRMWFGASLHSGRHIWTLLHQPWAQVPQTLLGSICHPTPSVSLPSHTRLRSNTQNSYRWLEGEGRLPFNDTSPSMKPNREKDTRFLIMSGASTTWIISLVLNTSRPIALRYPPPGDVGFEQYTTSHSDAKI